MEVPLQDKLKQIMCWLCRHLNMFLTPDLES
jgi:hypothetical protein